ncbi:hypothetical protein LTR16_001586 [Cryomyces antarcticus]|uniref:G-protein coupled receptors family 3 profile domain-containing protein n=1 Tax=Cryomyces antarcticus TaxID=329879 RepID=A0ABR0LZ76_9PEZI|nr:hypothetical protein LTR39_001954 [Cryomyces antarcticus]KAK5257116.1 hypothetical protein LTR16_001586 [Cryomyces antarcticus]
MAVCTFDGNSDMYGLGIRIGFYLQWYSGILASILAPSELPGLRFAKALFIAATFLALLILTIQNPLGLQVAEVYIILLLTFGSYLFFVPLYLWRIFICGRTHLDPTRFPVVFTGAFYSVLNFMLLVAVTAFQLWFWIARVPQLADQGCRSYGFIFTKVPLDAKAVIVVNLVLYSLLLLVCLFVLFRTLLVAVGGYEYEDEPSISERQFQTLHRWEVLIAAIVASTIITATELTIYWNNITNVYSLSSAGQTIPFAIGIGALLRVVYVYAFKTGEVCDTCGTEEGNVCYECGANMQEGFEPSGFPHRRPPLPPGQMAGTSFARPPLPPGRMAAAAPARRSPAPPDRWPVLSAVGESPQRPSARGDRRRRPPQPPGRFLQSPSSSSSAS